LQGWHRLTAHRWFSFFTYLAILDCQYWRHRQHLQLVVGAVLHHSQRQLLWADRRNHLLGRV
jgi:hypothetical protein